MQTQPLIEIERIGDAPPQPFGPGLRPLAGVRVLDLTRVLAGPACAKSLAEHGADALKISAAHLADSGVVELDTGIGKRSARLDLRNQESIEILQNLVRGADVFVQSYRPGALAGRGFSPEALAKLRPGIVCASLSAWGGSGPWRAREGGSWLVRVALARVGKWIVDRGTVQDYAGIPDDLPETELAGLLGEMEAPDGRIRYFKPVLGLSETPPYFARPPVPLGYHQPVWTFN